MKIVPVARMAAKSLTIIISLRLWRSTITPAKGDMIRKGVMKKTCISPMAVALSVCWYIQMVRPKCDMLEASTETIWPIQMKKKPVIPVGDLRGMVSPGGIVFVVEVPSGWVGKDVGGDGVPIAFAAEDVFVSTASPHSPPHRTTARGDAPPG
jgi:hypothetical protein